MASSNLPAAINSLARWDCCASASDCQAPRSLAKQSQKKNRADRNAVRPLVCIRSMLPLWLAHDEFLVRLHVRQGLRYPAWPPDLDPRYPVHLCQPEMHSRVARRRIAHRARHVVVLVSDANAGAGPVPIAACSHRLQDYPVVSIRADVLPDFRRFAQAGYDDVDPAVAIQVREGAAPVCPDSVLAGRGGLIGKRAVSQIPEYAIRLFVYGRFELLHHIVHVRICGEQILPTVIIEIEETNSPSAVPDSQRSKPAGMSRLRERSLAQILEQRKCFGG